VEIQQIREHLASARHASRLLGISSAQRLAGAAEALLSVESDSHESEREIIDAALRSVDVVLLLIHDAGRRQQGYPPAALHEAVFALMEHMERLRPGVTLDDRTH
jgi:chemotaxis protein histidine kinase CheA